MCKIENEDGSFIGEVINVENFGAGNLLEVMHKGKNFYKPLNDDNIVLVDINKKMIIAKPIKGIIDNV